MIIKSGFLTAITLGLFFISIFTFGCTGKDYITTGDIKVLKLDVNGTEQWNTTVDSGNDDRGDIIIQTSAGGYVISGENNSIPSGTRIPRIIELTKTGALLWDKSFPGIPQMTSVIPETDGGYIAASEGDQIFRLDTSGENLREIPLANRPNNRVTETSISSIIPTPDNRFLALINVPGSKPEMQIIKFDVNGSTEREQLYDIRENQSAVSLIQTIDGGYAVPGIQPTLLPIKEISSMLMSPAG